MAKHLIARTPHIQAQVGEIAETVLLPGDPLRAKFIADTYLENVKQFNATRNMFGFTGTYKGRPVSVMGTGMGCPSMGIYSYELIHIYGCKNLIRIGTAGTSQPFVHAREMVFGMGACTTSNYAELMGLPGTFCPVCSYELLEKAVASAKALGYTIADFAKLGLLAKHPVNLGSRCTVFMNSSVKQAQKDGASVEDISAGLSISIVKNAVYKVIRAANADDLGQHIVVQGGTFHNDAVLRAFEQELGRNVTRPTISGIMGAFGAALYARDLHLEKSALLSEEALQSFSHTAKPTTCNLCTNHCSLTVNTFDGGRRFISGNRCSRPLGKAKVENPDLMTYKYKKLRALQGKGSGNGVRGRMGIPFGLNMYENLPFWFEFFTRLNFEVVLSPESSRKLYLKGQHTIPSDTVCYPAKLLHGHVEALVEEGVDAIWYPCMSYNNDEGIGDNHYNCPVVAYYPELLAANVPLLKQTKFLNPYVGLWRHKDFEKRIAQLMEEHFSIPRRETAAAAKAAYAAYDAYVHDVREIGMKYIRHARDHHMPILVACGRPYHIDPEINHGINDLITSFGFVLVTEDALSYLEGYAPRKVLNQWTFQSRMYNAARYVCTQPDMQVVQLVSFGCGTDAITTDELRDILEKGGKLYTQLKIDDISNLGAVKIRIRSLMAAMEARQAQDARG